MAIFVQIVGYKGIKLGITTIITKNHERYQCWNFSEAVLKRNNLSDRL